MHPFDPTLDVCQQATIRLAAIGALVTSTEKIRVHQQLYSFGHGIDSIEIDRLLSQRTSQLSFSHCFIVVILSVRLAASCLAICGIGVAQSVVVVAVTYLLTSLRGARGQAASDQLIMILFLALSLGMFGSYEVRTAVLLFIAIQACLAYWTAGMAKLCSPTWRKGDAISAINACELYEPTIQIKFPQRVELWACRAVILFELSLPVAALLCSLDSLCAILFCGLIFHLVIAIQMRLNGFLWAFVACYPSILFANSAAAWILKH